MKNVQSVFTCKESDNLFIKKKLHLIAQRNRASCLSCAKMFGRNLENFPIEIEDLDTEVNKKISKQFSNGFPHLILAGPQKMLVPNEFTNEALNYQNFNFRKSDILVMGFPRSGTTMTQELLWLLLNDFNFRAAAKKTLIERVPLLESKSLVNKEMREAVFRSQKVEKLQVYTKSDEILNQMTQRRVMKTHLHFSFLPKSLLTCGCKIIYVARNPKDVVVSLFHLQRNSLGREYLGNFESFLELFLSDLTLFAPYWTHLQQGWEHRNSENVLFFFYENFLQNRRQYIEKIMSFIGENVPLFQLDLLDFCMEFTNFKKYMAQGVDRDMNDKENADDNFIRRGDVGGWKSYFSEDMNKKMNHWIKKNLQRTGIAFPEEIF